MTNEQVVWVPVPDFVLYGRPGEDRYVRVLAHGGILKTMYHLDDSKRSMTVNLPNDIRLCQATTVPAAASVPVDEIAKLLDYGTDKESLNEYEWHCYKESRRVVFDWLSTVTQEDKGDGG